MVVFIVILTVIVFVFVDLALRMLMKKREETKLKKERQKALDIGLKLDFSDEAKTLKHVEVENPKAKILAVDDEKIILDSFRKILVLAGYSIDTVEKGKEALGLIQKYDYDFVFTDLKMPEMDGVELTKSVKHVRPDIDVIVITGYATIETAVETMKFGAMDYLQKPFTEDELISYVNNFLIKRKDRIQRQMKPSVHLITSTNKESTSKHEINVPAGVFVSTNHTWVNLEMNGLARIGLDDFARKLMQNIDNVQLPKIGKQIKKGDLLFSFKKDSKLIEILSPIGGKVVSNNSEHVEHPEWLSVKPFELSWMTCIDPVDLSQELQTLMIGKNALSWYKKEIDKYNEMITNNEQNDETFWENFSKTFLSN